MKLICILYSIVLTFFIRHHRHRLTSLPSPETILSNSQCTSASPARHRAAPYISFVACSVTTRTNLTFPTRTTMLSSPPPPHQPHKSPTHARRRGELRHSAHGRVAARRAAALSSRPRRRVDRSRPPILAPLHRRVRRPRYLPWRRGSGPQSSPAARPPRTRPAPLPTSRPSHP